MAKAGGLCRLPRGEASFRKWQNRFVIASISRRLWIICRTMGWLARQAAALDGAAATNGDGDKSGLDARVGAMRRYGVISPGLLIALLVSIWQGFGAGEAIIASVAEAKAATPPKRIVNSITITNKSGTAISNYPFQFGRPFVDGAIANAPQVLINGQPVTTQADVKNRYPDGSVEFAVIAVVIPTLPATGSSTLTFQNQATGNNTPLTQAQMLSLSYNFVATTNLVGTTGVAKTASAKLMLQNGDYQLWTSGQVAQTIMLADDTIARKYDIGLGDGYHPIRP